MYTETKVQDMTVGQNVEFPTQGGGTHGGLILAVEDRGTETRMITVRYWDGSEATIRTSRLYTGYVETPATEEPEAAPASEAPQYAIEMHEGPTDRERRAYGVVHRAGCADLRDPEPVGTDWREGVSDLGTDWAMDVEDDLIRLAPCAR